MSIAVCALTFRRPHGLAQLLEGLKRLRVQEPPPRIRVIVVDNDPGGGARAVCDEQRAQFPWQLDYVPEPRPGIAAARNTALDHACDAEWIAFIDDDECPEPDWLDALLRTQRAHDADVVGGAVLPILPEHAPRWLSRGRFLNYNRHPTGTILSYAFTNNVLFRSRVIGEMNLRFSARYGLTGGEDRHFFQQIGMAGYRVVWCDEAVVKETIPPDRTTTRWILRREFRYGNTASSVETDLRPGLRTRLRLLALAAYRLAKGGFFLPLTWPLGWHMVVRSLQHICFAAGILYGLMGCRFQEYRRNERSP